MVEADAGRAETEAADAAGAIICPRCGAPFTARFYGPCPSCRDQLARTMRRQPEAVERPVFEPAMNVVPNQVATRE
jgi:hypothetical protein